MRVETNVSYIPKMRMLFPMVGTLMVVDENEPVYGVQESYARSNDGTGDHRYQVLLMPRGDVLSGFWTDLGPASAFLMGEQQAPPYLQPILMAHTVAECRHMADENRMDDFAARLLEQRVAESTLFADYARLIENDLYIVRNKSTFGPGGRTQRNGYSAIAARLQQERLESIRGY